MKVRISITFLVSLLFASSLCWGQSRSGGSKDPLQLQQNLMSSADTIASLIVQASREFSDVHDDEDEVRSIRSQTVLTSSALFNNAAATNPYKGLVDMVILVKLHRSVYEEVLVPKIGPNLEPYGELWRKLDEDLNIVSSKWLDPKVLTQIDEVSRLFRERYPGQVNVSYLRLGDLPASTEQNAILGLVNTLNPFSGVKDATEELQETRYLAERAIYLASRLPLLSGLFGELFLSQIADVPMVETARNDFSTAVQTLEALQQDYTYEKIRELITSEREAAISQVFSEFSEERKATLDQLLNSDMDLEPSLLALAKVLENVDKSLQAAYPLLELMEQNDMVGGEAEPFDPVETRLMIEEVGKTAEQLAFLMDRILRLQEVETSEDGGGMVSQSIRLMGEDIGGLLDSIFWKAIGLMVFAFLLVVLGVFLIKKI
jgi:hypothetical protein